jgi:rSAM-partnered protein
MSEQRDRPVDAPRAHDGREWEVFLRETEADPLVHAGSVSAPDRDVAHEQASQLFGDAAVVCWVCPADAVSRRQVASLGVGGEQP